MFLVEPEENIDRLELVLLVKPKDKYIDAEKKERVLITRLYGACIIKHITAVIYGLGNKLECLPINTRLGWKGLPGTNTLAYYRNRKLWPYFVL
jgi:hypothetical protein